MFERFTERARQVILLAQEEARTYNHAYIEPCHIVVGIIREAEGLGARVLDEMDITAQDVRIELYQGVLVHHAAQLPFSKAARNILEGALSEALSLGHNYIGTEHILLSALRDPDLAKRWGKTKTTSLRNAIFKMLGETRHIVKPEPEPDPLEELFDELILHGVQAGRTVVKMLDKMLDNIVDNIVDNIESRL